MVDRRFRLVIGKWVLVASDRRRSSLDGRILGCSDYPMQTALMFLVVLLSTLAVLATAGAIYQALERGGTAGVFRPPVASCESTGDGCTST
jgi:hypothetical protein